MFTCADNNNNKALYLYPIHAGLHLQLLHSFPGLGDAGRAVVGDAVLHGAPVTPNRCKGGGRDSVNVTLNQHPPGDSSTLMEQLLYYNLTPTRSFLHSETWKDPFCLSICYLKKLLCGHQLDSGLSFFSQRSCMIAFLPLSRSADLSTAGLPPLNFHLKSTSAAALQINSRNHYILLPF